MTNTSSQKTVPHFHDTQVPRWLLFAGAVAAAFYYYVIIFWFPPGNSLLYWALVAGQTFLIWQVLTYIHTVWNTERRFFFNPLFRPRVDVFITVTGEPVDIVEETARACLAMDYPKSHLKVHILNDGLVAHRDNWKDMEILASRLGIDCITRTMPGGAKAGNINHGLHVTKNPFVVIFDADHAPHPDFLAKTMGYFARTKVAFVQTPQYYKNQESAYVAGAAWEQQELFFGPICKGKNNYNAAPMCGTNMVIRREALEGVGGMKEESIAEDFVTGIELHKRGWHSIYVPEILAEGLAPEDFLSYYKQQLRWARGSLDALFRFNLLGTFKLTFSQKLQYLSSVSFFVSGIVIMMNALFPLIFLFTGQMPFVVTTMTLAAVFLPYMFLTLYILQRSNGNRFTFNALAFAMGNFWIHVRALAAAMTGHKSTFSVTEKRGLEGDFLHLAVPSLVYFAVFIAAAIVGIAHNGLSPAVANNLAWGLFNCAVFIPVVYAASPHAALQTARKALRRRAAALLPVPAPPPAASAANAASVGAAYSEQGVR
jgi:cellulose synthase (UDP-forming)